jgi:hypothetical protein
MNHEKLTAYQAMTIDQLEELRTSELLHVLKYARRISTCGCRHHCGDDYIDEHSAAFNRAQRLLQQRLMTILPTREHVPSKTERKAELMARIAPKKEKKQMEYSR